MATKTQTNRVTVKGMNLDISPAHGISTSLPSGSAADYNPIDASLFRRPGAALAAAILLNSLAEPLQYISDETMESRLKELMSVMRFPKFWKREMPRYRYITQLKKLKGFHFNKQSPLEFYLRAPFSAAVNLEKGRANFTIPSFIPNRDIVWPADNTVCRVKTVLAGIHLDTGDFKMVAGYSAQFTKKMTSRTTYQAVNDLPSNDYPLLIYCCGLDFFTPYGRNHLVRLLDTNYTPMDIVAVEFRSDEDND